MKPKRSSRGPDGLYPVLHRFGGLANKHAQHRHQTAAAAFRGLQRGGLFGVGRVKRRVKSLGRSKLPMNRGKDGVMVFGIMRIVCRLAHRGWVSLNRPVCGVMVRLKVYLI